MASTREMYRRMQAARKGSPAKKKVSKAAQPHMMTASKSYSNYEPPSLPGVENITRKVRAASLGDALKAENPTTKQTLHDLEETEKIVNNFNANTHSPSPRSARHRIQECRLEKDRLANEVEMAEHALGETSADVAKAQEAVASAEKNFEQAKLALQRCRETLKTNEEKAMIAAAKHMQTIHALRLVDKKLDALSGECKFLSLTHLTNWNSRALDMQHTNGHLRARVVSQGPMEKAQSCMNVFDFMWPMLLKRALFVRQMWHL